MLPIKNMVAYSYKILKDGGIQLKISLILTNSEQVKKIVPETEAKKHLISGTIVKSAIGEVATQVAKVYK